MNQEYLQFITDLKQNIIQSRYIAARLANKEQLLLYFKTGKMLSEKIAAEKWGANVLGQIAEDLQKQLPGLRGFSKRNLVNMRHLYNEYQLVIFTQSPTAQIRKGRRKEENEVGTIQLDTPEFREQFFGISFTHHILLLNKCKDPRERFFYIEQASTQFWSVTLLEHHINADLYSHQGKLPNNFNNTISQELKPTALKMFQDDYLMDFISSDDVEDERVFEEKVVADIKNFIMRMGTGFAFIGNQYRIEIGGEELCRILPGFESQRNHRAGFRLAFNMYSAS